MLEDLADHFSILYHADHSHIALALRTYQWIDGIYFLDQSRPVLTKFLAWLARIDKRRHIIFLVCLPSQATRFVTVVTLIPDHLLVFAGDMRCQLREPIQSIKRFGCFAVFRLIDHLRDAIGWFIFGDIVRKPREYWSRCGARRPCFRWPHQWSCLRSWAS